MSAPAQIPGFYYDQQKKKYFRILPHHAAPASSSFYTATSVQKAEDAKQASESAAFEASKALARRRRSPLGSNHNVRATLYRELGAMNAVKAAEDRRRVFVRGLERQTVFEDDFDRRIGAFAVGECEVDSLTASGGTKGGRETVLGVGTTSGSVVALPLIQRNASATGDSNDANGDDGTGPHPPTWTADRLRTYTVGSSSSTVTSVHISPYPSSLMLTTFLGGASEPSISIIPLSRSSLPFQIHNSELPAGSDSLWSATFSPSPTDLYALLGTRKTIYIVTLVPRGLNMVNINASTDIFALAYQYSSPTAPRSPVDTFLAGGRDGTVRLYDTRSRIAWRKKSGGQIMVQLGSPVCHVKMLDESGVSFVVNGLKKTAVFDLRFPHAPSPMRAYAQETKEVVVIGDADGGGGGSARGRRPQGKSMIDLGFDADPVRGVAAIAEEDEGGRVGLWSLRTGQRLRTLEGGEGKSGGICKGLQFDHTSEKSGLWASHGGVVEWWGI